VLGVRIDVTLFVKYIFPMYGWGFSDVLCF
jgi:hypothetical protein